MTEKNIPIEGQKGSDPENQPAASQFGGHVNVGEGGQIVGRDLVQIFVNQAQVADLESLPPEPGSPPYKGLNFYTEEDADLFFGREELTAELVGRLRQDNFLAVVGASGSGKSSLVRAGLIPVIRNGLKLIDGTFPPPGNWFVVKMTPTSDPVDETIRRMTRGQGSVSAWEPQFQTNPQALRMLGEEQLKQQGKDRIILLIDQFEELFTMVPDQEEAGRQAFIDNLLTAAEDENSPFKVVITMRADFYDECLAYEQLRHVLKRHQEPIGAMTAGELEQAILRPLAAGSWQIQQGLAEQILDEIDQEPGALPLLAHALRETWERRRGRTLTLSGYREAGGVRGAIAQTARDAFLQFDQEDQKIVKRIFLNLTELGEGTQDTRRRVPKKYFAAGSASEDRITEVVNELAQNRLIVVDTIETDQGQMETYEVSHEALIREWGMLRGWLEENRETLRLEREIEAEAMAWTEAQSGGGDADSFLYRGGRLARAQELRADGILNLSAVGSEFLDRSVALQEEAAAELRRREEEERERERQIQQEKLEQAEKLAAERSKRIRTITWALVGVVGLLIFSVLASLFALNQQNEALIAREDAVRQVTWRADSSKSFVVTEVLGAILLDPLAGQSEIYPINEPQGGEISRIGSRVMAYNRDVVYVWEEGNPNPIFEYQHPLDFDRFVDVALFPEGNKIAVAPNESMFIVFDVDSGEELWRWENEEVVVIELAPSPNGEFLQMIDVDLTCTFDAITGEVLLEEPITFRE